MWLLDVPCVDEDLAIDGLDLVGAGSEHFCDDVWSLPRRRELVMVFVALDEVEYQVPDIEGPTLHLTAVVRVQCLLVLSRVEEGNIAHLVELIHGI